MKKISAYFFLTILLYSCSTEPSNIKKALKTSIPELDRKEYKLKGFQIVETIIDANLRDSITSQNARILTLESIAKMDSTRLRDIRANLDDAKRSKASTLYYLRSLYDSIINQYEDMEEEIEESLETGISEIKSCRDKIKLFEQAIEEAKSPIIYYKVKHLYSIRGATRDTTLTIDSKYNIVKY